MRRGVIGAIVLALITLTCGQGCWHRRSYTLRGYSPCNCNKAPFGSGNGRLQPQPLGPGTTPPPITTSPPVTSGSPGSLSGDDWQPSEGDSRAELFGPRPTEPEARGQDPELSIDPPKNSDTDTRPTPVVGQDREKKEDVIEAFPVDIFNFKRVKRDVYAGEKPFVDGIPWLKEQSFKTVLHLHLPTQDVTAIRRQFEAKGLRYVSLEVSPKTLTREVVDQFNHVITDATNLRLFVFDKDRALAGSMWYLHFRIVDQLSDEDARKKASEFGPDSDDDSDLAKEMQLAVQNYLRKAK